ncbi:MAG: protein kinase [Bdellovibrionales bacterium]|nr:protein kinase [Bdellovibrionales bacterium]
MHPEYPIHFGKYLLLQRIAVGGMAEVFRAKLIGPKGFEKKLAIKRILPEYSQDEEFVQMFVDEARISSHLHHANIIQVFDFGEIDHQYYLAMELVEGTNLKNLFFRALKQRKNLSRPLIYFVISKIASALEYAHQVKVDGEDHYLQLVHRDVSPQNILISRRGEIKITDFGIAKAAIKLTQTQPGKIQGKYSYMSPEQALGRSIDHRSDIFSLGIIFFELLTGKKVYGSSDSVDRYKQATKAQIPRLGKVIPDIPNQIDELVMQMLAKDPKERPNNCTEIVSILSDFIINFQEDELMRELGEVTKELFPGTEEGATSEEIIGQVTGDATNKKENIQWQGNQLEKAPPETSDAKEKTAQNFFLLPLITKNKKIIFSTLSLLSLLLITFFLLPIKKESAEKPAPKQPEIEQNSPVPSDEIESPDSVNLEMELIQIENEIENIETQLSQIKPKTAPKKEPEKTVVASKEKCPAGMKWIEGGLMTLGSSPGDPLKQELLERPYQKQKIDSFCIDQFEFPNQRGHSPTTNVTFQQALDSCKSVGKTLCTEAQWERACKGPSSSSNQQFPYGSAFVQKNCNVFEHDLEATHDPISPVSGNFAKCVSSEGIFDLSGSVHEWTATHGFLNNKMMITKGGAFDSSLYASRCSSAKEVEPDKREATIGFRCCK